MGLRFGPLSLSATRLEVVSEPSSLSVTRLEVVSVPLSFECDSLGGGLRTVEF